MRSLLIVVEVNEEDVEQDPPRDVAMGVLDTDDAAEVSWRLADALWVGDPWYDLP